MSDILPDEGVVFDVMDAVCLPDQWGYDYEQPRIVSPYMLRGLAIAVIPTIVILLLVAVGISL